MGLLSLLDSHQKRNLVQVDRIKETILKVVFLSPRITTFMKEKVQIISRFVKVGESKINCIAFLDSWKSQTPPKKFKDLARRRTQSDEVWRQQNDFDSSRFSVIAAAFKIKLETNVITRPSPYNDIQQKRDTL